MPYSGSRDKYVMTLEEVRDELKQRIDIFAEGDGFVFNTIHNVAPTPLWITSWLCLKQYASTGSMKALPARPADGTGVLLRQPGHAGWLNGYGPILSRELHR